MRRPHRQAPGPSLPPTLFTNHRSCARVYPPRRQRMFFLKTLSTRIDDWSRNRWIFGLSFIPFFGMLYVLESMFAYTIPSPGVPDNWQHVFTAESLHAFLDRQTPETLAQLRLGGLVDCAAPLVYVGPFGFLLSRWFNATLLPNHYWHPGALVNLLPILVAVFDEIENIGLLLAYHAYPTKHWGGGLAGQVTMFKWMTIYVMGIFIISGGFLRFISFLRGEPVDE